MGRNESILVTGASGFLGGCLARALIERGREVHALTRNAPSLETSLPGLSGVLEGDLTQADGIPAFPANVQTLIHSAGMLGQFLATEDDYSRVNTRGTENMLRAAEEAGVGRFMLISSAGVLGPTRNPPADESDPLAPSNPYERSKAASEELARECHSRGRTKVQIVRPEFVYGPRDMHVLGLFRAVRDRRFVIIGKGTTLLHPTYIDDAVEGMLAALDLESYEGKAYLIAGPSPVTVRELGETAARVLGIDPPRIRIPRAVAWPAAAAFELLGRVMRRDVPLNFSRVRFFTENRAFKTDLAGKDLGYRPEYSLEDGMTETVRWYRQEGLL